MVEVCKWVLLLELVLEELALLVAAFDNFGISIFPKSKSSKSLKSLGSIPGKNPLGSGIVGGGVKTGSGVTVPSKVFFKPPGHSV
jgi:hypothetical protein